MGFGGWVWGVWFRVRAYGLKLRVKRLGVGVQGTGFRVQDLGLRVEWHLSPEAFNILGEVPSGREEVVTLRVQRLQNLLGV